MFLEECLQIFQTFEKFGKNISRNISQNRNSPELLILAGIETDSQFPDGICKKQKCTKIKNIHFISQIQQDNRSDTSRCARSGKSLKQTETMVKVLVYKVVYLLLVILIYPMWP